MNCKFCNAELETDVTVCPVCGKEQEEAAAEVMEETVPETASEEAATLEAVAEEAAVEEPVTEENVANGSASIENPTANSTKPAAIKSGKSFWIVGAVLLGLQLLISSGNTNSGYVPFADITNWSVFLYDLTFFLSSNFIGVIGAILLIVAAVRTFGAKNTPAPEAVAEETAEVPAEPAKASTKKLTAAIIALVLVAGILIGLFAGTIGSKPAEPTEPAETVAQIEIPSNGDPASPKCKASYTVSDEEAAAAADVVVATMGTETLTNGELQAFYWQEIYMFLMENYTYAQYMGLDLSRGLDTQLFGGGALGEDDMSWQQFFLDGAISSWKTYQALELEAVSAGFVLPEEEQKNLDNLESDMQQSAASYGFDSVDAMLQAQIGASCSMEDYYNYVQTYFMGMSYYYDFCENLAPTDQEIEAHFAENEDYFTENGITKDAKFVNVRHVLLQPEGGETGEDGYPVFTDEAWEACRVKVEELYNKWQEGDQSEESFAQLAMENSVDGSAQNGGLYENVYVGQMVPEFENWCFDETRVAGDHGLVKTQYGYHIMFFSANRSWMDLAKENLISTIASDKIPQVTEQYASEVDFSAVKLALTTF